MLKTNERAVSLDILEEILKDKAYNNIALSLELNKHKELELRDRAFVTELVNGVLRNKIYIDYVIAQFSTVKLNKLKPVILNILRQAVYEILFMKTADYALCSEAVNLAKARGLSGLSPFVNGVLRTIIRKKENIKLPSEAEEYLSVRYSVPKWIISSWLLTYDYDFVEQMCRANNQPPGVSLCANTLKTTAGELALEFSNAELSKYSDRAVVLKNAGALSFDDGRFHVQDIASQIAVLVLEPKSGDRVVDLCAAPGGKSFLAAYLMENKGEILSFDLYSHKIKLINEGADRLGIDIIRATKQDSRRLDTSYEGCADCVIVDAPCSGLGLLRKKPDIKYNRKQSDIPQLQRLQRDILSAAAGYVRKGGSLVYSTCTITEEENIENVRWFLENYDFTQADIGTYLCEELKGSVKDGCLCLFPHVHETDGFFISKFVKEGKNA